MIKQFKGGWRGLLSVASLSLAISPAFCHPLVSFKIVSAFLMVALGFKSLYCTFGAMERSQTEASVSAAAGGQNLLVPRVAAAASSQRN